MRAIFPPRLVNYNQSFNHRFSHRIAIRSQNNISGSKSLNKKDKFCEKFNKNL